MSYWLEVYTDCGDSEFDQRIKIDVEDYFMIDLENGVIISENVKIFPAIFCGEFFWAKTSSENSSKNYSKIYSEISTVYTPTPTGFFNRPTRPIGGALISPLVEGTTLKVFESNEDT